MMTDRLSPHFRRREFTCRCGCGFDTVDAELLRVLEDLRSHFDKPVTITSGCRCPAHNQAVGGADHSQHTRARAADVKVTGINNAAVADYLETKYPGRYGIGRYASWTHIDTRPVPARW